jgi:hypothetical protein
MTNDHIYWTGVHLGALDRKGKREKKVLNKLLKNSGLIQSAKNCYLNLVIANCDIFLLSEAQP